MKQVLGVHADAKMHWVGDGFPVRTLFHYDMPELDVSPFLLLDVAGPHKFTPAKRPRGVGAHPHRGFETVTIVYDGEVAHRDSAGNGGVIGPGDVQWMTAAGGIMHEEFHSTSFTQSGGPFRMVQLWVNLPATDKMGAPGYQGILSKQIPRVDLPNEAGVLRVIAGLYEGHAGPARTFTEINVWDMQLAAGAELTLPLPEGHTSMLAVLSGQVSINTLHEVVEGELVALSREHDGAVVRAECASMLLVLTGKPLNEPVVGYGPFVMNTEAQIRQSFEDLRLGRFGALAHV